MTIIEGTFAPPPGRFALAAARFNSAIVDSLVAGALDALKRHGVDDNAVDVVRVPGSFEIPLVAQRLAASGKYVAVICLARSSAATPTITTTSPARRRRAWRGRRWTPACRWSSAC